MELHSLFTKQNLQLLEALDQEESSLRDLAERAKVSPAKVHQASILFNKIGLITTRKEKNRKVFSLNRNHPLTKKIKALANLFRILSVRSTARLKKKGKIILYGSYARGEDDAESDVDLMILTTASRLSIQPLIRQLSEELGKEVRPNIMTREEFENLEKKDAAFTNRVNNGVLL
jgi:predicted nucleotidyltransferase